MNIELLARSVDVHDLRQEALSNENCWAEATARHKAGDYFLSGNRKDGTYIPLRVRASLDPTDHTSVAVCWTSFADRFPLLTAWIESGFGLVGRVFLYKIPVGQQGIPRHIDSGEYYRKHNRYHLCLQGRYRYEVGGEEIVAEAGDLFWFDNQKMHTADNLGDVDRISVVFDVLKNSALPHNYRAREGV